ncbi:permease-like cell division protein FtsX [Chakrabartyella piscis]|uniref:permease-like cell division protein FtsX n=1 Tax=Chakrabartyella piscis TaxID=2918914 RepID=UPI002958B68F|nr:permease-like cell division protein FtsX [Chakrabartyella piscis]
MKPRTIRYFLEEGVTGLKKNLLMTMASIMAVMACITILSFSYIVTSNLEHVLQQMEDSIGISVFIDGEPDSAEISRIRGELEALDYVTFVEYISPAQALDALKADWGADEDIFTGLDNDNNPLSHSFQLSLSDMDYQTLVLTEVSKIDGIGTVRHGQAETELITKLSDVLRNVGIVVMALLSIISVTIITNTIRISVANRRVEINIMKYVGATDTFIRWPFIVEGMIIGLVGAAVPLALSVPLYSAAIQNLYAAIPVIEMVQFRLSGDIFVTLAPMALAFGIVLGIIGSTTSIRKHLRV